MSFFNTTELFVPLCLYWSRAWSCRPCPRKWSTGRRWRRSTGYPEKYFNPLREEKFKNTFFLMVGPLRSGYVPLLDLGGSYFFRPFCHWWKKSCFLLSGSGGFTPTQPHGVVRPLKLITKIRKKNNKKGVVLHCNIFFF